MEKSIPHEETSTYKGQGAKRSWFALGIQREKAGGQCGMVKNVSRHNMVIPYAKLIKTGIS